MVFSVISQGLCVVYGHMVQLDHKQSCGNHYNVINSICSDNVISILNGMCSPENCEVSDYKMSYNING